MLPRSTFLHMHGRQAETVLLAIQQEHSKQERERDGRERGGKQEVREGGKTNGNHALAGVHQSERLSRHEHALVPLDRLATDGAFAVVVRTEACAAQDHVPARDQHNFALALEAYNACVSVARS